MTRAVVLFVVAIIVFATASVSFAHGGGTTSLLNDEEQLEVNFTATEGADTFETVEQPPDRGQSRSGSRDHSNSRPDTTLGPPAAASNHTVAPPTLPTKSTTTAPTGPPLTVVEAISTTLTAVQTPPTVPTESIHPSSGDTSVTAERAEDAMVNHAHDSDATGKATAHTGQDSTVILANEGDGGDKSSASDVAQSDNPIAADQSEQISNSSESNVADGNATVERASADGTETLTDSVTA